VSYYRLVSTTILVATITALSTLSGGLAGSIISLRIHHDQIKELNRFADQEHAGRRITRQRDVRREAYVLLLNHFDGVDNIVQSCWQLNPLPERADAPIPEAIITVLWPHRGDYHRIEYGEPRRAAKRRRCRGWRGQRAPLGACHHSRACQGQLRQEGPADHSGQRGVRASRANRSRAKRTLIEAARTALEETL